MMGLILQKLKKVKIYKSNFPTKLFYCLYVNTRNTYKFEIYFLLFFFIENSVLYRNFMLPRDDSYVNLPSDASFGSVSLSTSIRNFHK